MTRLELPPGAGKADIQVFAEDGQWNKPDDATAVHVTLISGGSGGNRGSRTDPDDAVAADADSSGRSGGDGGDGGGWVFMTFPAALLDDLISVTVGAGGTGAPGATSDNSAPSFGGGATAGSPTQFGSYLVASPATSINFGDGGTPKGGTGGKIGNPTASLDAEPASTGAVSAMIPGALAGPAGVTDGENGGAGTGIVSGFPAPGGSGGGGAASTTGAGGDGGNGAGYGAGGGGGGASYNGHVSGAGGNGAPGICVVTTYF